ncbi:MAG: hypothetical protein M2R45_02774 [Verrucomicrobia subdivision 3 bacterium]|nr:hypothetical protein [Limisphaerales bacterium]MCS1414323.1 hypothetical protein [Limisphaerales bacterium]
MITDEDKLRLSLLAKDLSKEFPRSPRETLAGYVIAARMLDKCRAAILNLNADYHFDCPLDRRFLSFAEVGADSFEEFVATGASDAEVAEWIEQNAKSRPRIEIVKWNNRLRELKVSELPDEAQEFLEGYIAQFVPRNRPVYRWFDVYDLEEQRI